MVALEGLCSQVEARWFYWGWAPVYDKMQKYFTSDAMREAGLDLVARPGDAPVRVLDVGAGTGTLSRQVLQRWPDARLTLLDQSPEMLSRARVKPDLAGSAFVLSDAQVLPFDDDSFDCAVSSGSLYYYPQPIVALQEQLRVVRPGGQVLAMGSLQPKPLILRILAQTFNRFPTEDQYMSWFQAAGLSDIRTKHISNPWNATQYALAICGTKLEGASQPARAVADQPTTWRRLRGLLYLPIHLARFSIAMVAFAIIGPLQILNARKGMARLASEQP
eukprot:CAMPEP_0119355706 /NCGR_PEP_ID=MMETSP1334-20130426/4500_1 /TAXON_ID=127549 /ORGANISM="Calcidiscus leptoporus, Strain RCC1130" /LENGTH=275 /DNA_ID=CAMNT_0007369599 /DNA_START=9 /DNA_END=836 /DNA_ORIENTATION=+